MGFRFGKVVVVTKDGGQIADYEKSKDTRKKVVYFAISYLFFFAKLENLIRKTTM